MAVPESSSPADGPLWPAEVMPRGPRGTRARRAAQQAELPVLPREVAWDHDGAHWYFLSFAFIGLTALIVALVLAPVVLVWRPLWPLLIFGPVIVPCVVLARATELTVSSHGIEFLGERYPWEALELADSDLGEVLRPKRGRPERGTRIYLRMYSHDWRASAFGQDLRTWAPELLGEEHDEDAGSDTD